MCKYYRILNGLLESKKEMGSSTKVLFRNNAKMNSDLEPVGREVIPVAPRIHTVPPVSVLFPQFIYGYNKVHSTYLLQCNCSINGADIKTIGMSRSTKSADV